ncbi:sugar transporter SWEET1-like [Centruroides sculpturatus]|uniref:sugar transporter SWEET1-like n=1 Tax=Centruroides sculpturatus TaxID=218467 RepID=UPI000C6E79A9|nr:sugar transporter SWEET1-like [Centruroides sculpturatus]XP_023241166.1 sugar transporter SWEET1-like [Centruroides sculpturatus]
MEEFTNFQVMVGHLATVFTIIMFLTGVQICLKIWRQGSSTDISFFPFIAGLVSASLWLQYGLFVHDAVVIMVNSIGVILQLCYVFCYYIFTPVRVTLNRQIFSICIALVAYYGYLNAVIEDKETATLVSGLTACCAGLIFCASPLASLAEVRRTKTVESLPFLLILFSFFVTSLWFIYGLLLHDSFIQIPNLLGCIISGFQLLLFVIYPSRKHEMSTM